MKFPNFIIIGELKCATTSLYRYICQSPEVKPCKSFYLMRGEHRTKEMQFFNEYYWEHGIENYKKCFPDGFTGEATPTYFSNLKCITRMKKILPPDTKYILCLRNPIDRAYSHYQMLMRNFPKDMQVSFETAIKLEQITLFTNEHFHFLKRSLYFISALQWQKIIGWKNTLIIRYEDLKERGEQVVIDEIFKFLGLKPFKLNTIPIYSKFNYPLMKDKTRQELQEYFKPYNQKLYKLLGRDFKWD